MLHRGIANLVSHTLSSFAVLSLVATLLATCASCGAPSGPTAANPDGSTASTDDNESNDDGDSSVTEPDDATPAKPRDPNQVLRHAVFFKFKEESSDEDVQGVVEAFADLPNKIDVIKEFEWGTNNSPENLNDEFTHCFLLTFDDEKGRKTYLPHPDHAKFGDVLGPHNSGVFVIDYWGQREKPTTDRKLRHLVFFKFKDDASEEEVQAVEEAFAALPSQIDAIKGFEWGKNNSPERHHHGFTHCFMVTFDSEEGRTTYLEHPEHTAFVDLLKPFLDKARVLDYWPGS